MRKKEREKTPANEAAAATATLPRRTTHGPEPERLKIQGDWKDAVSAALRKPKPPGGWPK
jgi:hypothetical protein